MWGLLSEAGGRRIGGDEKGGGYLGQGFGEELLRWGWRRTAPLGSEGYFGLDWFGGENKKNHKGLTFYVGIEGPEEYSSSPRGPEKHSRVMESVFSVEAFGVQCGIRNHRFLSFFGREIGGAAEKFAEMSLGSSRVIVIARSISTQNDVGERRERISNESTRAFFAFYENRFSVFLRRQRIFSEWHSCR